MKTLSYHYEVFIVMSIFPQPEEEDRWIKARNHLFGSICALTMYDCQCRIRLHQIHNRFGKFVIRSASSRWTRLSGLFDPLIGHLIWREFSTIIVKVQENYHDRKSMNFNFIFFKEYTRCVSFFLFLRT